MGPKYSPFSFNGLTKQQKFLCAFLIVLLGSVAGMLSYQLVTSYRAEIRQTEINNANLGLVTDHYITQTFTNADYALLKIQEHVQDLLASGKKLEQLDLDQYLKNHGTLEGKISGFRICNKKGLVIFPSGLPADQARCGDRDYFLKQKENPQLGLYISDPIFGRITRQMIIILSRRLNDPKGEFVGTVHVSFKIEEISKFFSLLNLGKGGIISLWSNKRIPLARFPYVAQLIGKKILAHQELISALSTDARTGQALGVSAIDKVYRFYHFRKMNHYPFTVVLETPKDTVLKNWQTRLIIIIIGLGLIFISTILAFIYYVRSSRQLQAEKDLNIQISKMTA